MYRLTGLMIVSAVLLAVPGLAAAQQCEFAIEGNDAMQFDTDEMHAAADCDQITVTLEHTGQLAVEQMGHNWVLTKTENFQDLARAGQSAGLENDYLPEDRSAVIAKTDMVGGGETTSVTFDGDLVEKGVDYTFFCSFPGHWSQMQGEFRVM